MYINIVTHSMQFLKSSDEQTCDGLPFPDNTFIVDVLNMLNGQAEDNTNRVAECKRAQGEWDRALSKVY
jgi:hypothetical protein